MSEQSTQEKQKPENPTENVEASTTPENAQHAGDTANSAPQTASPDTSSPESESPPVREPLSAEDQALVEQIAQDLGETQAIPLKLLEGVVRVCGADFAKEVLAETFKVEANGGLMTNNGKRRRTIGGVFFYVARGRMTKEQEAIIYEVQQRVRNNFGGHKPPFDFDKRSPVFGSLAYGKGVAESVRVTIIGRPGKVNHFRDMVVMTMAHDANDASLPAGIPAPPAERVVYTLYMSFNQWNKLAPQMKDEGKALVIEGILAYDEKIESMAVYVTKAITRNHRPRDDNGEPLVTKKIKPDARPVAKNAPGKGKNSGGKKAGAQSGDNGKGAPHAAVASRGPDVVRPPRPAPVIPVSDEPEMPEPNIPDGAPPDVASKLRTLHIAAHQYRLKIASLEEKPENKRFGLDMTKKLLANTERQITELESKYAG